MQDILYYFSLLLFVNSRKIVAMYRVKNESRWIEKSIRSIYDICDEMVVLDDGSTDDTVSICLGFDKVVNIHKQMDLPLDETRDRNYLLQMALKRQPNYILYIDGDEIMMPNAKEILFEEMSTLYPNADVFEFQLLTLWDGQDKYRTDGIFGNYWQKRLHNMKNQPKDMFYKNSPYKGNLHCGNLNNFVENDAVRSTVKMYHCASFDEKLRKQKYEYYNRIDPNNPLTDGYKHMISGEGRFSGPRGIELEELPESMVVSLT